MKKIFTTLVFSFSLCQLGFTFSYCLPEHNPVSELSNEIFAQLNDKQEPFFTEKLINGVYYTKELNKLPMTLAEYRHYGKKPIMPKPETQITKSYKKATINVPAGYALYNVNIGKKNGKPYLYLLKDNISMQINGKKIYFKLDYEINFSNEKDRQEFMKLGYDYSLYNKPLKVIIKYDPRYFTLQDFTDYVWEEEKDITFNNMNINLNTVTEPVLYLENQDGETIYFVLKPDFQNLYNDFEFVRNGHKEVKFVDFK